MTEPVRVGEVLPEVVAEAIERAGPGYATTLLKACGNRRASVCPACSATYQADSFQLLAAGLRGGKGVPETLARHPRLFRDRDILRSSTDLEG